MRICMMKNWRRIALALTVIVVAFAAANWTGITEFLGSIVGGWDVNESAIVTPAVKENTGKWLNLTATEAYWVEDGVSVVLRVDAADDKYVACYQHEDGIENEDGELGDQIKIGEEMIPVDKW